MHVLIRLFQQARPFGLEQLTGLMMCVGAILLIINPQALVFAWFEQIYAIRHHLLAGVGIVWMLVCGVPLALMTDTSTRRFAALTMPVAGYGFLLLWYAVSEETVSPLPGHFIMSLWGILQYAHEQAEVIRQWTKPSESSSKG